MILGIVIIPTYLHATDVFFVADFEVGPPMVARLNWRCLGPLSSLRPLSRPHLAQQLATLQSASAIILK